jgi:hypothetical protein
MAENEAFSIPTNLSDLTPEALRRHRAAAVTEFNTALSVAQGNPDQVTEESLARMEALNSFVASVDEIIDVAPASTTETGASPENIERLEALSPVADLPATQPSEPAPTVADIAGRPLVSAEAARVVDSVIARSAITASAGLAGYSSGQTLEGIEGIARALQPRLEGYRGLGDGISSDPVASIKLPLTEFAAFGDRRDLEVMDALVDESRLPGGSLVEARYLAAESSGRMEAVTASGWCAPSEIDYSIQFHGAAAGLYDAPTMPATRGGVWIMPEIDFSTVYGMAPAPGSNFFDLSEADIIAGSTKTFVEVDCPVPVEYRLGVTGFGLVAGLLQLRAYPEYVREFTRASLIALQQYRSAVNVASVVTQSTAVDLSAVLPWSGDGTVLSNCLAAAEMAAVDARHRARLLTDATIEQVWPLWILADMRADFLRRNGTGGDPSIADAWVMAWFRNARIAPQFIYGWQDRFGSDGGVGFPGSTPPITAFPTSVRFLSYPAGTWVNAVADVIQLSTVYDSVRLASNTRIEFFTEQGNLMIPRRSDSRVYTVPICPSGKTGLQRDITCSSE